MADWVEIAKLDQLPHGQGMRVEALGHRIAVFRIDDDVYAVGDVCSHAEASLSEGEVFDDEVECPRHGASFDLKTGKAMTLPATRPVPTYEVRVDEGVVSLLLEEAS